MELLNYSKFNEFCAVSENFLKCNGKFFGFVGDFLFFYVKSSF